MTNKAMKIYEKQGRFQNAAKIQKKLAEQFEQEMKYELAIHSYKKAADYFTMENSNFKSYETGCLLKAADIMCNINAPNAFSEAVKIYEKVGMYYLTVPLLKGGAKDLFFKIVSLYLAYDVSGFIYIINNLVD